MSKRIIYILLLLFLCKNNFAQSSIEGKIYDETRYVPIPNVEVLTSSGFRTMTDSIGNYNIRVNGKKDSIWFNYNGKNTLKYPVDTIKYTYQFNVGLSIKSPLTDDKHWLSPVTVFNKTYRQDSIENRLAYDKIFHPDKGGFRLGTAPEGTFGVGIDLDALINAFRFGYNKRQEIYKRNIIDEEQYKYVNHRFTRKLVAELTQLDSIDLDIFMKEYRPDYYSLSTMNDIALGKYIKNAKDTYLQKKNRVFNDPFVEIYKKKQLEN
ncbi:MAG: hypothetical protein QM610_11705 [Chitinophagaceae bacterium]